MVITHTPELPLVAAHRLITRPERTAKVSLLGWRVGARNTPSRQRARCTSPSESMPVTAQRIDDRRAVAF